MKKYTRKIALALVLVMMMLMSLATVPAFAEGEGDTITIYFQNNWLWSEISCHYWGSAAGDTTWPGISMEKIDNDGTYDIYALEIPADVAGIVINGKKDDGSGTLDQTPDITEGIADGAGWSMTWVDANAVLPYSYSGTGAPGSGSGSGFGSDEPVNFQDTYIYFKNDAGWENVYYYCWNLDGGTTGEWPGIPMTMVEGGYYVAFISADSYYTNMKFNDGGKTESAELKIPYDGKTLYNNKTNSWSAAPDIDLDDTPIAGDNGNADNNVDQQPDGNGTQQPQKQGFFAKMWQGIVNFFKSIGTFFVNLFGGKKK